MGQFLLLKYRLNKQFSYSCIAVNKFFDEKTSYIGIINKGYKKLSDLIYKYANSNPAGA